MKERVVNNLSLKLLSVGLAFIIWLAVVNISNPEVTRTKTVSLNVVNGDVLSNAGKAYEVQNGETVVVSYQVRTRDAYRITADDFRASIDLRDLYAVTGSVPVTVEVMRNKELISGTPTARPGVVRVLTEDIQNKSFSLTTATDGTPADGFEVGSMTLTPATVMVSGPVSQVGRISSAGVRVSVEGISDDQMGHADVTYYDANGNEISFAEGEISVEPKEIYYDIDMLRGKSLPLSFTVSGEAAEGFRLSGTECSVKSVAVVGEHSLLENLTELKVSGPMLSIEGAREDKDVTLDLNHFLPDGVTVSGNPIIVVTLKVEALNTKAFQLSLASGIDTRGKREDYVYQLTPDLLSVELSGLPEELAEVDAADLKAYIDLTGFGVGLHAGELRLTAPEGTTVASVTPFTVVVSPENEGPGAQAVTTRAAEETQDESSQKETVGPADESAGETPHGEAESEAATAGKDHTAAASEVGESSKTKANQQ
ncbi:YbbR domain-containing protein [Moryella indoligenes]|uniref:YbbR domain-containing protein n=1 Tax=Moryella indoligenes TaxID=371674 RepID=A0AAE3VA95_9FIRM|nr:CdaR family protein [Moryella indoligenes]MDQ0152642.1 YbbR domain-containing protein [Moryella indoligenes]